MIFWGCIVQQGKGADYNPSQDDVPGLLHLSQACLDPSAPKNSKATLMISPHGTGDKEFAVVALSQGRQESAALDLVLDANTAFKVQGNAVIHLTGYFMPEYEVDGVDNHGAEEQEGDDTDEYEDEESDEEDDYSTDDSSDYFSSDTSEDESFEDDSDDEKVVIVQDFLTGVPAPMTKLNQPIIEDITEMEQDKQNLKQKEQSNTQSTEKGNTAKQETTPKKKGEDAIAIKKESKKRPASQVEDVAVKQEKDEKVKSLEKIKMEFKGSAKKQKNSQDDGAKQPGDRPQPSNQKKDSSKETPKEKVQIKREEKESAGANVAAGQVESGSQRVRRFANGFEIEDVKMGPATGKLARPGKKVVVKYVGRLKNGNIFDQTKGNKTFTFRLGVGEVIKGWDRGVDGMRVGDVRKLTIPPQMGYGSTRTGPIPPNSTLLFTIELVDVKN